MSTGKSLKYYVKTSVDESKINKRKAKLTLVIATWKLKFSAIISGMTLGNGECTINAWRKVTSWKKLIKINLTI
tara:strand:- start:364 stop:585 length:222 start_codon:yes stop_codon:yes gene_type:complete